MRWYVKRTARDGHRYIDFLPDLQPGTALAILLVIAIGSVVYTCSL